MDAAAEAARGMQRVESDALLLSDAQQEQQHRATEKRRQLWFTVGAAVTSSLMLFSLTYETRWISAYLGKTQFEAYSIAHSAVFYLKPLRNLWSGITSKVARAVGQHDDVRVSKLMKMSAYVTGIAFALTWSFYLPIGPWLLKSVYETDDDIYQCAQQSTIYSPRDLFGCVGLQCGVFILLDWQFCWPTLDDTDLVFSRY